MYPVKLNLCKCRILVPLIGSSKNTLKLAETICFLRKVKREGRTGRESFSAAILNQFFFHNTHFHILGNSAGKPQIWSFLSHNHCLKSATLAGFLGNSYPKFFPFLLLSYLTITHVGTVTQGPQLTLIMATNGITFFMYFFNSGKLPSSLAMTLLSGNFPLLF